MSSMRLRLFHQGRTCVRTRVTEKVSDIKLKLDLISVAALACNLSAEGLIDISPNRTRRVTDVSQKNALELESGEGAAQSLDAAHPDPLR